MTREKSDLMYHNKKEHIPPGGLPSGLYILSFQFHDMRLKELKYQFGSFKNVQKTKKVEVFERSSSKTVSGSKKLLINGIYIQKFLICMSIHFSRL